MWLLAVNTERLEEHPKMEKKREPEIMLKKTTEIEEKNRIKTENGREPKVMAEGAREDKMKKN